jgi:hypothetical protein
MERSSLVNSAIRFQYSLRETVMTVEWYLEVGVSAGLAGNSRKPHSYRLESSHMRIWQVFTRASICLR